MVPVLVYKDVSDDLHTESLPINDTNHKNEEERQTVTAATVSF